MSCTHIPRIDISKTNFINKSDFVNAYSTHQAIHIRGLEANKSIDAFSSKDMQLLFQSMVEKDKISWCIENISNDDRKITPCEFLDVTNKSHRGYCSFLLQHSNTVMESILTRLPMTDLPMERGGTSEATEELMPVKYGICIWFFFGKNYKMNEAQSEQLLLGRPEHTDSVSHDGTWHYQLSGTKIWRLRPTNELMDRIRQFNGIGTKKRRHNEEESKVEKEANTIEVECKQGDILLLNTRLWWHSTVVPVQDVPSISYARDMYFKATETHESNQQSMTNVDGNYAAQDIEADTILFTEHTMPDCELHRSETNPNCQVVELQDDSTGETYMAIVSLREIKSGEFFCVLKSDSEESEEGKSEGDWDEEE